MQLRPALLVGLGVVSLFCRWPLLAAVLETIYPHLDREGVITVKKPDMSGVKRVNINIPINLHNSFKAATAARGENMTDVLLKHIEEYINKYGPAPAKKGRRG